MFGAVDFWVSGSYLLGCGLGFYIYIYIYFFFFFGGGGRGELHSMCEEGFLFFFGVCACWGGLSVCEFPGGPMLLSLQGSGLV